MTHPKWTKGRFSHRTSHHRRTIGALSDHLGDQDTCDKAADRIAASEAVITALIEDAMQSNWDDEDHESEHVEAWRKAMQAIGYDPAAGEENG
jgi:hypothetical protein